MIPTIIYGKILTIGLVLLDLLSKSDIVTYSKSQEAKPRVEIVVYDIKAHFLPLRMKFINVNAPIIYNAERIAASLISKLESPNILLNALDSFKLAKANTEIKRPPISPINPRAYNIWAAIGGFLFKIAPWY
jgi:hypothetical protein